MDFDFTPEQELLRKSVAEFLAKECTFDTVKELEEADSGYSPKLWKKMAELGWMELLFPEAYGGLGDAFSDSIIMMEEMGKKAFPSPYFSTVIICGLLLLEGGSEVQKQALLPKIAQGKLLMAAALYEDDGSYLPGGVQTTATPSGNGYQLDGVKMFVMDANIAHRLIIAARIQDDEPTLFMVDTNAPGIRCEKLKTIGMDNTCRLTLENVQVAKDDIIGEPGMGWDLVDRMFSKAVAAKCAEMLGGCGETIEMTTTYAKQREQYGTPIGGFQAIQHYLADMRIAYDTSLYYLQRVTWMIDEGLDTEIEVSALKAYVNEKYKFITDHAVQIHGGIGTTREFNVGLFYRRAKTAEFALGDTEYHHDKIVAKLEL